MPSQRAAPSITWSRAGSAVAGCTAPNQIAAERPAHAEKLRFMSCSCTRRGVHNQAPFPARGIDLKIGIIRNPDKINLIPGIKDSLPVVEQDGSPIQRQHELLGHVAALAEYLHALRAAGLGECETPALGHHGGESNQDRRHPIADM